MQYLIGPESPAWTGTGLSGARFAVTRRSDWTGAQRYASVVQVASCPLNLSPGGRSMISSVPWNRPPMYSRTLAGGSLPGCGPLRFAFEMMPFPLATSRCRPSGVTRTEVGYQPTGMKPSERLLPGVRTSKTATLLLSALATNSVFPSGASARLFGVEPGGKPGYNEAIRVSSGFPVSVSITVTLFRAALATYKIFPYVVRNISQGCSWVGQRVTSWLAFKSMTATEACAQRLT